jgi:hypothetical protein
MGGGGNFNRIRSQAKKKIKVGSILCSPFNGVPLANNQAPSFDVSAEILY